MQHPPAHMPALDGLRGLAIFLVLLFHASTVTGPGSGSLLEKVSWLVFGGCWAGVDLFFVLSGFLITGILLATRDSPAYFRSFYTRRLLRIFPLYYLFLAAALAFDHRSFTWPGIASLLFFYYNLYIIAVQHHLPWVNGFWSLAVEEQFYLVWPFLVAGCTTRTLRRLCIVVMLVALAVRLIVFRFSTNFPAAYDLTPCRVDELLMGALLAIWRRDPIAWRAVHHWSTRVAAGSSAVVLAIVLWSHHFFMTTLWRNPERMHHSSVLIIGPGMTCLALLFAALVAKATTQGTTYHLFLHPALRRMGRYSYGMYILHWPILTFVHTVVLRQGFRIEATSGLGHILVFPLLLGLTFGSAFLSFHLFEKHFLALKRQFPAR